MEKSKEEDRRKVDWRKNVRKNVTVRHIIDYLMPNEWITSHPNSELHNFETSTLTADHQREVEKRTNPDWTAYTTIEVPRYL